ncbi:MBL fold metallo-hydrolase [Natronomonas sp. EA1]|uniref:MBL fold metallo-hydrolase n=1 Tax=Natronomonas sp. EA1 TaxID=3421655 RepID=UPI003EB865B9
MAKRLADGVWLLELGLVPPLATNVYLVDDRDVTLVDTGLPVNYPSMRDELAAAGYSPEEVDRVLLTHYDIDHVGGLGALPDAAVYLGATDLDLLRGDWTPPLFHHKGAFHRAARRLFPLTDREITGVDDGDRIGGFEAVHTPGHNPGHTVYVHEELGLALTGDLLWEDGGELTPPFWLDSYDMHELRSSIRTFADRATGVDIVGMAHGDPVLEGATAAIDRVAARV